MNIDKLGEHLPVNQGDLVGGFVEALWRLVAADREGPAEDGEKGMGALSVHGGRFRKCGRCGSTPHQCQGSSATALTGTVQGI